MRRWIAKLRAKELIKVIYRPGRPSIIDVSPLVAAAKRLVGWQEQEQPPIDLPTAPVEMVQVIQPEDDDLFWLQAASAEPEDALAEADWKIEEVEEEEEDIEARMDWQRLIEHVDRRGHLSWGQRRHLDDTQGLYWQGQTLMVRVRDQGQIHMLEMIRSTISLAVLDVFGPDYEVQFQPPKKKPKKLGPIARLAVAAVGV